MMYDIVLSWENHFPIKWKNVVLYQIREKRLNEKINKTKHSQITHSKKIDTEFYKVLVQI